MVRHRFHSICPYYAMFPEKFVERHLVWSKVGEVVFDPFSGRGTTVFESLLRHRRAAGCDVNPVAVCLSNAKANPPQAQEVSTRLSELARLDRRTGDEFELPFFRACFHESTLGQLLILRDELDWRASRVDCFIAAMALGCLHGESHRSERYFSNRMPRTISTKPAYSVRWWAEHGCQAPERDVFTILQKELLFRFTTPPPRGRGQVVEADARHAAEAHPELHGKVKLIVTSPPYLNVTDFEEDQWLRLWLLGGGSEPRRRSDSDHRHRRRETYWKFLEESWAGVRSLLREDAHIVVRLGGRMSSDEMRSSLSQSLEAGLGVAVRLHEKRESDIEHSQRRVHLPSAKGTKREHDFHFSLVA